MGIRDIIVHHYFDVDADEILSYLPRRHPTITSSDNADDG